MNEVAHKQAKRVKVAFIANLDLLALCAICRKIGSIETNQEIYKHSKCSNSQQIHIAKVRPSCFNHPK